MWSDSRQQGLGSAAPSMQTKGTAMSAHPRAFLQVDNLAKAYQSDKPVFAGVDFGIHKGEFVCIIGHSGCGKTTILNVLAGLDTASEGHAFMDGREIAGPSLERGVVFQGHALMPWLTVRQNIAFAVKSRWPEWNKPEVDAQVEKYVAMVGLSHAIDKKPSQLSGGMKQRVGIARAFAGNPAMVIADEPVSALDVSVAAAVTELLMDIQRESCSTSPSARWMRSRAAPSRTSSCPSCARRTRRCS